MVGTGERSEKIRTYNFPEGRVTDHRIKHTSHQLANVLAGGEELDGFTERLNAAERSAQLAEAEDVPAKPGGLTCEPAQVVRRAAEYLERHGVESPVPTAERLLSHVLRTDRTGIYARDGLTSQEAKLFGRALCRRCAGEPLQHVTGEQGFRRLVLRVRPGVFVPRPETEVLVQVGARRRWRRSSRRWSSTCARGAAPSRWRSRTNDPTRRCSRPTSSPEAVALARENADALGLAVTVLEGDLLEPLPPELRGRAGRGRVQPALRAARGP